MRLHTTFDERDWNLKFQKVRFRNDASALRQFNWFDVNYGLYHLLQNWPSGGCLNGVRSWNLFLNLHHPSTAMLVTKRSTGVAPDVNLRIPMHQGEEAHKSRIHPGFEIQGTRHQKSKAGVSMATRLLQTFSKVSIIWPLWSWESSSVISKYSSITRKT